MEKLTVKINIDKSSIKNFLIDFFDKESPETYNEDGNLQCAKGYRRSVDDMCKILKSYFNKTQEEMIKEIVKLTYFNPEDLSLMWCCNVGDMTIGKYKYDDGFYKNNESNNEYINVWDTEYRNLNISDYLKIVEEIENE